MRTLDEMTGLPGFRPMNTRPVVSQRAPLHLQVLCSGVRVAKAALERAASSPGLSPCKGLDDCPGVGYGVSEFLTRPRG